MTCPISPLRRLLQNLVSALPLPGRASGAWPFLVLVMASGFLALAPAATAAAQEDVQLWTTFGLIADEDGSGGPSCGDRIRVGGGLDSDRTFDLTNSRVIIPYPGNVEVVPDSLIVGGDATTDCTVIEGQNPGDTRGVIECPFICASGTPSCASNGIGFHLDFRIRDPNLLSQFTVTPWATGDQIDGTLLADLLPSGPLEYEPCPPPPLPPVLQARLTDALVQDLDGDGRADVGDTLRYTATLLNVGEVLALAVELEVPVPQYGTIVPGSVSSINGATILSGNDVGDSVVSINFGTLSRGFSETVQWEVVVGAVPPGVGQLSTQGLATSFNADSVPTDDPDTPSLQDATVTALDFDPVLALTKRAVPAAVAPGELLTWDLDFTNSGRVRAPGAVLREVVPEHTVFDEAGSSTGWSCADGSPAGTACVLALGDIGAGASGSREFAVRVVDTLPAGVASTTNEATLTEDGSEGPEDDLTDNVARAQAELVAAPDVAVEKTGPAFATPESLLTYRVTATNAGDQDATGVRLTEEVPAHARFVAGASDPGWACDGTGAGATCVLEVGSLEVGAVEGFDFAVRVVETLPAGAEETVNRVVIGDDGGNGPDPRPGNDRDTVTTRLDASPQLTVRKSGPDAVRPGEVVPFRIDFANHGNQDASGVEIREVVPAHTAFDAAASSPGWSCSDGSGPGTSCVLRRAGLAAGASGTVVFAVRVASPLPAGLEVLRNRVALVRDPGGDPPDDEPDDEIEVPVDAAPDLAVRKDGPAEATEGGLVSYSLTVANEGDQGATGVVLTETPPPLAVFDAAASDPRWTCGGDPVGCELLLGDVAGGASLPPVAFVVRLLDEVPPQETEMVNTATVGDDGANGPDADPSDNSASLVTQVRQASGPPPGPAPELVATLADHLPDDDGNGRGQGGDRIAYTALVRNAGDGTATEVTVDVPLDRTTAFLEGSLATTGGQVRAVPATGSSPGAVLLAVAQLEPGSSVTVTWEVALNEPLPAGLAFVEVQGSVSSEELPEIRTDDPDTAAPADPTRTPLEESRGGPPVEEIPTLSEWGLALLVGGLLLMAFRRFRGDAGREVTS